MAALTALALALAWVVAPSPALAHDGAGEPGTSDAEHAREDLVGIPIDEIERRTRARAEDLADSGIAPRAVEVAPDGDPTDPGEVGAWSRVVPTPVVPVFQAVLPSGRVLMWDSVGDTGSQPGRHDHTRAVVWDPETDNYRRVDVEGYNIFCAGYTQLPDGDVLVVGGNEDDDLAGIRQTHVFDWQTATWSRGPDMDAARWYPSVAALADGSAVIVGGGPDTAEVYAGGVLRMLTGFAAWSARVYPFLVPRTDGRVELVGPGRMETMDTRGAGSRTTRPQDDYYRQYGSFATYRPDLTLVAGGGTEGAAGRRRPPLATAKVVDTSTSPTTVRAAAPMAHRRRQFDLTVLPDGSVLATGGISTNPDGTNGLIDTAHAVTAAERWDPDGGAGGLGAWTTLSSAARTRQYHSSAALLPDGRVMTGGGGVCGPCVREGYLEKNVEYFSPPYLFRHDGSGLPAPRPVLQAPDDIPVGETVEVTSSSGPRVTRLSLVKLGAPTHGVDQGQRFIPLEFERSGSTLTVDGPASFGVAPPGYYLLFGIDEAGTPSVASTVRVPPGAVSPPEPPDPPDPPDPGSDNWARARPAAASAGVEGHRPGAAVDGSLRTWWQAPPRRRTAWWVDLGAVRTVDTVVLVPHGGNPGGFRVQVSTDGKHYRTVAIKGGGSPRRVVVSFEARDARQVRILAEHPRPRALSLAEVEVRGPA